MYTETSPCFVLIKHHNYQTMYIHGYECNLKIVTIKGPKITPKTTHQTIHPKEQIQQNTQNEALHHNPPNPRPPPTNPSPSRHILERQQQQQRPPRNNLPNEHSKRKPRKRLLLRPTIQLQEPKRRRLHRPPTAPQHQHRTPTPRRLLQLHSRNNLNRSKLQRWGRRRRRRKLCNRHRGLVCAHLSVTCEQYSRHDVDGHVD